MANIAFNIGLLNLPFLTILNILQSFIQIAKTSLSFLTNLQHNSSLKKQRKLHLKNSVLTYLKLCINLKNSKNYWPQDKQFHHLLNSHWLSLVLSPLPSSKIYQIFSPRLQQLRPHLWTIMPERQINVRYSGSKKSQLLICCSCKKNQRKRLFWSKIKL